MAPTQGNRRGFFWRLPQGFPSSALGKQVRNSQSISLLPSQLLALLDSTDPISEATILPLQELIHPKPEQQCAHLDVHRDLVVMLHDTKFCLATAILRAARPILALYRLIIKLSCFTILPCAVCYRFLRNSLGIPWDWVYQGTTACLAPSTHPYAMGINCEWNKEHVQSPHSSYSPSDNYLQRALSVNNSRCMQI